MLDHVLMMTPVSLKHSVSQVTGFIKGRAQTTSPENMWAKKYFSQHFLVQGYFVSMVGREEKVIREYAKIPEKEIG